MYRIRTYVFLFKGQVFFSLRTSVFSVRTSALVIGQLFLVKDNGFRVRTSVLV